MYQGRFWIIAAMAGLLVACSNTKKDEQTKVADNTSPLYELPATKDLEKAARLNIELGYTYLRQDQVSRAKGKFLRAKSLAPQLPDVHYAYGFFLERVGENEDAEKAYQKAVKLNPKLGEPHHHYGSFLCRQHQYRKAEKEFLAAVEDPNYTDTAVALENAGQCVSQIPDVAKATEYFERSLRYDPNRANTLLELAIIRFRNGDLAQAKEYHNRFVHLSKPTARSLLLSVEMAKRLGDRVAEKNYSTMLHAQFPNAKQSDLFQVAQKS